MISHPKCPTAFPNVCVWLIRFLKHWKKITQTTLGFIYPAYVWLMKTIHQPKDERHILFLFTWRVSFFSSRKDDVGWHFGDAHYSDTSVSNALFPWCYTHKNCLYVFRTFVHHYTQQTEWKHLRCLAVITGNMITLVSVYFRLFRLGLAQGPDANCTTYEGVPKVPGLAVWSENCKWYSSLPLCAVVSLLCESV
jgi:hypothetical protein